MGRRPTGDTDLATSLEKMVTKLDMDKIFYIQVGDAERLSPPITPHHGFYDPKQHKRMSWSRNARLFAFEHDKGAHLPVDQVLDTLVVSALVSDEVQQGRCLGQLWLD